VEIRLLNISAGTLEKLGLGSATKDEQGRWRFSDIQVFSFLEAVQGDRSFNVMQAPKMTVFNGQKSKIEITDNQSFLTLKPGDPENPKVSQLAIETIALGQRFSVRPTVSPDLRYVKLDLGVYLANLEGLVPLIPVYMTNYNDKRVQNFVQLPQVNKVEWEQMLKCLDGETTMVHLRRNVVENRNEYGPPTLSKLPYLSRLFKNTSYGRDASDLYLMVTPRIIINREEEVKSVRK
jgi:type II secretory pathway component GspD/PulD (secretin)